MLGDGHPERGQRDGPGDGEQAPVGRASGQDRVPDLLAQLAQGHRAQLDLPVVADGPAAAGRRLERPAVTLQAEHGDDPAIDRELAEPEAGPGRHRRLAADQPVHHAGGEVPVPALGLDQDLPVPAVPGRVRDQAGQAGPEHDGGDHGRHRGDGPEQRGPDRDGLLSRSRLQRVAAGHDRGCGEPGGRRGMRDGRGPLAVRAGGRRVARARHHGQRREQDRGQQGCAGPQDQAVRLDPAGRIELAHLADRGQRGERYRAGHGQDRGTEDRRRARQAGRERGLGPAAAQGPQRPRCPGPTGSSAG